VTDTSTTESTANPNSATNASFNYQTTRGYRYKFDIALTRPTVETTLGDPGFIDLTVDPSWSGLRITNETGTREAPLAEPEDSGDYVEVLAWYSLPLSLVKRSFVATSFYLSRYKSAGYKYAVIDSKIPVPGTSLPIGDSLDLQSSNAPGYRTYNDFPNRPAGSFTIRESQLKDWQELFSKKPAYYAISTTGLSFGNDVVAGNSDFGTIFRCRLGMSPSEDGLPIIAFFKGDGTSIGVTNAGCKIAQRVWSATAE
jgi:hypothetical protein